MIDGMADENDLMIAHNLPSFDLKSMISAYLTNDHYRKSPARVKWYHEILSFSPSDKEKITQDMLNDIARKYINARNPSALCFAVAHTSEAHQHLHFCFSGTEFRSRNTLRMDDGVFQNLREGMEHYQMERFPELEDSIVYLEKEKTKTRAVSRDRNARKERAFQAKKRLGKKKTEKESLSEVLRQVFNESKGRSSFYENLEAAGYELSERNGVINGIQAKRKYRFATLGVSKEMFQTLDQWDQRNQEIMALNSSAGINPELER